MTQAFLEVNGTTRPGPRRHVGTISQLPSGRWSVRVRPWGQDSRIRLPGGPWDSHDEAERALARWVAERPIDAEDAAARQSALVLARTPLREVYLAMLRARRKSLDASTDRQTFYRNVLSGEAGVWVPQPLAGRQKRVRNEWVSPVPGRIIIGDLPTNAIHEETILAWRDSLLEGPHPLKPVTVAKWGRHLSQLLAWAVGKRYITSNPMDHVELFDHGTLREQRPPRYVLTLPEMVALSNAAPAEHRLLIDTLLWSGMRQGEVRALRPESFRRLDSVWIDRAVHDGRGAPTLGRTKTTGSKRRIVLPGPLDAELREYVLHLSPGQPLFPGPSGGWMRGDDLNEIFAEVREAAGLLGDPDADNMGRRKPPTPHDCRATGASILQAAGAHAPVAQGWLGHANAQITLDLYTEVEEVGAEDRVLQQIRGESLSVGGILDAVYRDAWHTYGKPSDRWWPF